MTKLFVRNNNVDEFICSVKSAACDLPPRLVVHNYSRELRILERSVRCDYPLMCESLAENSHYQSFFDYLVGRQKVACCVTPVCWIVADKTSRSLRLLSDLPFVSSVSAASVLCSSTDSIAESKGGVEAVCRSDIIISQMLADPSPEQTRAFFDQVTAQIESFIRSCQSSSIQSDANIRLPVLPFSLRYQIHELIDQNYNSALYSLSESETDDDDDSLKKDSDRRHVVICPHSIGKANQYRQDGLDNEEVKVVSLAEAALVKDRKKRKLKQKLQQEDQIKKSRVI